MNIISIYYEDFVIEYYFRVKTMDKELATIMIELIEAINDEIPGFAVKFYKQLEENTGITFMS